MIEQRSLPERRNILADELIRFRGPQASKNCPCALRRVVVWDKENERQIVLLTNHLDFGATTIGAIYKDRWQIELFFKALKHNLKVKTFVGTSENALHIQIWTATSLVAFLRWNLFTYRDLWEWIDNPHDVLPIVPGPVQSLLPLRFGQQPAPAAT